MINASLNHPRKKGKARKADKKVRTIAGRLVRDVERKLGTRVDVYQNELELYKRVLAQKKKDKNKVYSLQEVDVQCFSKGKEHKQYEFGNIHHTNRYRCNCRCTEF